MLKISNLTVSVEDKTILNCLDLIINDGEIHAIMGKNGIGKSSLCKAIMHDTRYNIVGGNIIYNGDDLTKMETSQISQKGIMLISQNPCFIEGISNAEMLRCALRCKENKNVNIYEFNKEMENICDSLKLSHDFIHKDINVGASGGEKKKVELLHMGILKPSVVILDELDSGLDVDSLKVCAKFINDYYKKTKCTIIMITHHENLLKLIKPNYVHILDGGKIIKTGDASLAKTIENSGFSKANVISEVDKNE